jgi:hypothetical protein
VSGGSSVFRKSLDPRATRKDDGKIPQESEEKWCKERGDSQEPQINHGKLDVDDNYNNATAAAA